MDDEVAETERASAKAHLIRAPIAAGGSIEAFVQFNGRRKSVAEGSRPATPAPGAILV